MKTWATIGLLAVLTVRGSAQQADSVLTFDECFAIALKNNLDVNRSGIRAATDKVNMNQAKADLFPDLNARLNHGINQGRSIDPSTNGYVNDQISYASQGLDASVLLFNGMRLRSLIGQYSAAYQASLQEEQQAKDNLKLNLMLAYLAVLTDADQLQLAKNQRITTEKQAERLEVLNKNGDIAPGEFYDLKGQFANDQIAVINAANALETARIRLSELMNVPYSSSMQLAPLTADEFSLAYGASADEVYRASLDKLAIVKAVDLRKKSADMQVKASRGGFYPSVYLNGGLSSNYSSSARDFSGRYVSYFDQFQNNLNRSFSVGVSIPIFNAFRTRNNVSLAKLVRRETELVAQSTRVQLQQLTNQAYLNMQSAKERYLALKDQVDAYAESFRTADIRFNAGAINSVDYLVAKNNLDRTRLNLVAATYDFILRKKVLDFYQGK